MSSTAGVAGSTAPGGRSVLGVVLCGGSSRRMGRDKARVELAGRPLLAWALGALEGVVDEVVLASGSPPRYAELGLEEVADTRPGAGPLAGLETALRTARRRGHAHVALLACDMPRARPELLRALLERARRDGLDALTLCTARGVEPLFGIYSVRCSSAVTAALEAGERRVVSFHRHFAEGRPLHVASVSVEELGCDPGVVLNLNTPEELRKEREAPRFQPGKGGNPAADRL